MKQTATQAVFFYYARIQDFIDVDHARVCYDAIEHCNALAIRA